MRRTANDITNRDQNARRDQSTGRDQNPDRDQSPALQGGVRTPARPRAFSVIELIVVIVIIGLILAIVLPGLGKMTSDARFSSASQSVQAAFTRAYVAAQADRNMTAIRFVPQDWELNPDADETEPTGRQQMVTYTYRTSTDVEDGRGGFEVGYRERLTRREGSQSVRLPANVWVAPAVTLERDGNGLTTTAADLLTGDIGDFLLDPSRSAFYSPDDFVVVFDPQTGVRGGVSSGLRNSWPRFQMRGFDPSNLVNGRQIESDQIERYNFSGIVIYKREPFLALGTSASADERQDVLRRFGRPYFVHRYSGGLVMGSQETQ